MMIVVLGNEETKIDDGHRLLQARMERSAGEVGGSHSREPVDNSAPGGAKLREDL